MACDTGTYNGACRRKWERHVGRAEYPFRGVVEVTSARMGRREEAIATASNLGDVSEHMGVVPSTATENIQRLARREPVTHERATCD